MNNLDIASTDINFAGLMSIDSLDEDIGNYKGFVGKAYIYDEEVFVNTNTGEGYNTVVSKMNSFIDWYSGHVRLAGFDKEDVKQLMFMILFDGIRRYNPMTHKNIKLSTFLYVHIKNRIVSRIKEENRQSLNATYNEPFYRFMCQCGLSFISNKEEGMKASCNRCKSCVNDKWKIRIEHYKPVSLDSITTLVDENEEQTHSGYGISNNLIDLMGKVNEIKDVEYNLDLEAVLMDESKTTRKIAELIYHKDYSITDAAKEVGLSCWAASLRLKKMGKKRHIRELFLGK